MTIWLPDLETRQGPRYRALAEAIATDIESGTLADGARLPPQRDLAYRLGVTIGTVSRAYALVEQRGLVSAEVGRGTFVRAPRRPAARTGERRRLETGAEGAAQELVDLTINEPADRSYRQALAATLVELGALGDALGELLPYVSRAGLPRHRAAGAAWLARSGLDADPERVIVTGGAHQAIVTALAGLARPGDVVLAEALSYSGLKAIAISLHLRLEGVAMDEHGLRPDALDAACRANGARLLFTNPTLHNPSTTTQPRARREEIVAIARRHDLVIVEDDVYGLLRKTRPPTFAALAPERTVHVSSVSKSVAPGLRVGFLLAPDGLYERIADAKYDLFLCQPPLTAEVVAHWLRDGTADRLLARQHEEAAARQAIAAEILDPQSCARDPGGYHVWMSLPAPWRASDFVAAARERGIVVAAGHAFAVARSHAPHAVRISLSAAADREQLARALGVLREIADQPPAPRRGLI